MPVFDQPSWSPLYVKRTFLLAHALEAEMIAPDARVMYFELNGTVFVFQTLHLAFHHVVQGDFNGQPWMVSFCVVCNAGAAFNPLVNGMVYHFAGNAMYNAMTLLVDDETKSFWNHLTGKGSRHGTLKGAQLEGYGVLSPATAKEALETYPDAQLIFSQLNKRELIEAEADYRFAISEPKDAVLSDMFIKTLDAREDTRLPRLDMGLGVWTGRPRVTTPTHA